MANLWQIPMIWTQRYLWVSIIGILPLSRFVNQCTTGKYTGQRWDNSKLHQLMHAKWQQSVVFTATCVWDSTSLSSSLRNKDTTHRFRLTIPTELSTNWWRKNRRTGKLEKMSNNCFGKCRSDEIDEQTKIESSVTRGNDQARITITWPPNNRPSNRQGNRGSDASHALISSPHFGQETAFRRGNSKKEKN